MRVLVFGLYFVLVLGAITTVYPFLLMLATSITNRYDYDFYRLIPRYLHDDKDLFCKWLYEKDAITNLDYEYGRLGLDGDESDRWTNRFDMTAPEPVASWADGEPGPITVDQARAQAADFDAFRRSESFSYLWRYAYFNYVQDLAFDTFKVFQDWVGRHYTLEQVRAQWGVPIDRFDLLVPHVEEPERHGYWPVEDDPLVQHWIEFKRDVMDVRCVKVLSIHYAWFYYLRLTTPGTEPAAVATQCVRAVWPWAGDWAETAPAAVQKRLVAARWIADPKDTITTARQYNAVFGTHYARITDVQFPRTRPAAAPAARLWERFVRDWCPVALVRVHADPNDYRAYLAETYGTVEVYNRRHNHPIRSFDDAPVPVAPTPDGAIRYDLMNYMMARRADGAFRCPIGAIEIDAPEWEFQRQLRDKYSAIDALNRAWGTRFASFDVVTFPVPATDQITFWERRGDIRRHFITSNYSTVASFILLHSRALWNTFVLVVGTVLAQLTVNPMAAYALSRFRLRSVNKILIFLLATMAFPFEVALIPSFLMLKEFSLLNTYWALILPGVANGFSIFLLKGFFDSLPPELYEAAIVDGAGELRLFARITLPLSKPILAVIALQAFALSYGAFMFAFLVCQDKNMWTLMVFLYEYQQDVQPFLVMASLVIASIPTLLVFLLCQRVILRGIVIPSFK